jgi:hypothetical protein
MARKQCKHCTGTGILSAESKECPFCIGRGHVQDDETTDLRLAEYVEWIDTIKDPDSYGFTIPGWYFWNETQTYVYGPYDNRLDAYKALRNYVDRSGGKYAKPLDL